MMEPISWNSRSNAMNDATMLDYYSRRAAEYERVYDKPERQNDQARLRDHLKRLLAQRHVLELACGTGYWTAAIADVAASITATDASEEVLAIAMAKGLQADSVRFARADAWHAGTIGGDFDAGLAAFWWSHIPKQKLAPFLAEFHAALKPGARVVFADNRFAPGSSTPISRTDAAGNTFQTRSLDDGSTHEVLKNFPTREELLALVEPLAGSVDVLNLQYFWCLSYELRMRVAR
jgi:demethylmenaquinone methyltransferase/2-methoxy-6-polyprenyl-1,4-benzoquinol methylase